MTNLSELEMPEWAKCPVCEEPSHTWSIENLASPGRAEVELCCFSDDCHIMEVTFYLEELSEL